MSEFLYQLTFRSSRACSQRTGVHLDLEDISLWLREHALRFAYVEEGKRSDGSDHYHFCIVLQKEERTDNLRKRLKKAKVWNLDCGICKERVFLKITRGYAGNLEINEKKLLGYFQKEEQEITFWNYPDTLDLDECWKEYNKGKESFEQKRMINNIIHKDNSKINSFSQVVEEYIKWLQDEGHNYHTWELFIDDFGKVFKDFIDYGTFSKIRRESLGEFLRFKGFINMDNALNYKSGPSKEMVKEILEQRSLNDLV